jgi:hypothetical protein
MSGLSITRQGPALQPNLYANCPATSALLFPFLLAMSASNIDAALSFKDLTREEQFLHHYAAVVKKNLQVYIASPSRDEQSWRVKFRQHFVFAKFSIRRYKSG